eukprot:scaffold536_cov250-Pinguiococcus_pyrenoidosus.AAC.21
MAGSSMLCLLGVALLAPTEAFKPLRMPARRLASRLHAVEEAAFSTEVGRLCRLSTVPCKARARESKGGAA